MFRNPFPIRAPRRFALSSERLASSFDRCAPSISRRSSRTQAGFTLIEVLVALIVLVLGVLGSAAMTLNALRDDKQSALRSQATALAYELGDLMRANPGYESVFSGSAPSGIVSGCYTTAGCSPADMASSDYYQWQAKLTLATLPGATTAEPMPGLPNASYRICRDATLLNSISNCDGLAASPLVVKLKWDERFNNGKLTTDFGSADKPNLVVAIQPY